MFLDKDSLKREIANYSVQAYKQFMDKSASLNDSIADIVVDNEIQEPAIISRIVETTNHLVQATLMKEARANGDDRSFVFDLADASIISGKINTKKADLNKSAAFNKAANVDIFDRTIDIASRVNVLNLLKTDTEKTASSEDFAPLPHELVKMKKIIHEDMLNDLRLVKKASADMESDLSMLSDQISEKIGELKKYVESAMYNEGLTFSEMYKAASAITRNTMMNDKIFNYIRSDLIKEGSVVSKSLISDNLKSKDHNGRGYDGKIITINGHHQLAIIMDNLNEYYDSHDSIRGSQADMHVAKDAIIKEIHDLTTNDQVQTYLDRFYRKNISANAKKYQDYARNREDMCCSSMPFKRGRLRVVKTKKTSTKRAKDSRRSG